MRAQPPAQPPEGPALAVLTQRLAATPPDLLDPAAAVGAVLEDVLLALDGTLLGRAERARLRAGPLAHARGRLATAVVCWLVLEPGWRAVRPDAASALAVASVLADQLAPVLAPSAWVADPAGREEAARAALRAAGLRPAGETAAVAEDRWDAVSTAVRLRVVAEVAEEVRGSLELARALAARRAREAAAQYTNV